MARKIRMAIFLFVLMFVFRTNASADSSTMKTGVLIVNGEKTKFTTFYDTVEELLQKEGIVLNEKDTINVDPKDTLNDAMPNTIKIERGYKVSLIIDDEDPVDHYIRPSEKAGHIILELKNKTGIDYNYDGYLNDSFEEGDALYLRSAVIKEFVTAVKIPYEREVQYSEDLLPGVSILTQEGQYGEMTTTTEVVYESGIEVARHVSSVEVTVEPVKEITLVGDESVEFETQLVYGGFIYEKKLEMEATAYSAQQKSLSNYTATGDLAVYGVVAVDPDVIPLGSWVYIEGYGKALASDTGGDIKGNRIDLCFNTVKECFQFGRRDITVYVLK